MARYRRWLPWLVLAAVVSGGAAGVLLHALGVSPEDAERLGLGLPGDLFLRALQMVVVPLIIAAIITGVSGAGDLRKVGKLGLWTAVFYLGTTAISVAQGLLLVNLIEPGKGVDLSIAGAVPEGLATRSRGLLEFLRYLVSTNPVADAAADLGQGRLLPLLLFCMLFGGVLTTMSGPGRETVERFFEGLYEVMLKITDIVILFTPVGVFSLLLRTMTIHSTAPFESIGLFGLTVVVGLGLHAVVVLPLMLRLLARRSPFQLFRAVAPALITAFSTCSSSAALPLTLECAVDRAGIPRRIVNFMVPLGATINMHGSALYEAVAALFIAQAYGIDMSLTQQASVLVMAVLAAVGTAGIPAAALVMISIVLGAVGLPLEGIGLILVLDRLLDMGRTAVNVWGDVTGAAIYHALERQPPPPVNG